MFPTKKSDPALAGKQRKCAYVALFMKGDAHIPGGIVLAHSLKRAGASTMWFA